MRTILTVVFLILGAGWGITSAAPLPEDGPYFKVGVGYSPYTRTALDLTDIAVVSNGFAPSMVVGVVWGRRHSLDVRWQTVYLNSSNSNRQGYLAVTYTRYMQVQGPAPFLDIGFGFQHGPQVGSDTRRGDFETTDGIALTFGAGVRFSRKFEVAGDYAVGSSGRFFTPNNNFDFSHRELMFSIRYTLIGG